MQSLTLRHLFPGFVLKFCLESTFRPFRVSIYKDYSEDLRDEKIFNFHDARQGTHGGQFVLSLPYLYGEQVINSSRVCKVA